MATNRKIYEIRLEDISQNGTLCANPSVEFEKPYCTDIRCYTEESGGDYPVSNFVLKIEVPEDCPDGCVYAIIDCEDDCGECEPERIQICPCTLVADCPDCHECVNNLCVTTCDDEQICSGGQCVDCDDDNPCPCNQVCVNGDCQCPPSRPFLDDRGCCSDCDTTAVCPPCYVCTPDGCVPIVCPEGVCDPETSECVECNGTGDCAGDNECCVDKVCDCCFGFVRDPGTGDCVPDPGCIADADCPECEICTETGCEPQTCPAGYIATGSYPCCLKECDCDAPDCPGTQNCVIFDDTTCVCAACTGACDGNRDCGEGCHCEQGQCVTNPCYGWCFDGTDCGENCGCNDGRCVPCDSLSCAGIECDSTSGCNCEGNDCVPDSDGCFGTCDTSADCGEDCGCYQGNCVSCAELTCDECAFAKGCDCVDEINCEASICQGPCVNGNDCGGVDCGCLDGECVQCQAYSCIGQPCPTGCSCGDDDVCVGNPCANVDCESNADCGVNCYCAGGTCEPCPSDNPNCGDEACGDLLIVGKDDDNCELEATLTQDSCCGCRDIVLSPSFGLGANPPDGGITLTWRVGTLADVPHHSALPAVTAVLNAAGDPILPTISAVNIQRRVYKTNGTVSTFALTANGGAGVSSYTITETAFPPIPGTEDVVKIEYVLVSASATFDDECSYDLAYKTVLFSYDLNATMDFEDAYILPKPGVDMRKITSCRSPLFLFRKASALPGIGSLSPFVGVYGTALVPPSPTDQSIWKAEIGLADGLDYNKYYMVTTDCGCADPAYYTCLVPGEAAKPLVFCHLDEADIEVTVDPTTNCTQFDFDSNIVIDCDVMAGATPQPSYRVLVNGAILNSVPAVTAVAGTIPLVALGTINAGVPVTSVGLRIVQDLCPICDVSVDVDCDVFEMAAAFSKAACDISGTYTVAITTTADPLEQLQYTVTDSGGVVGTASFYNSNIIITGLADPAGAEPITVDVERISDSVVVSTITLFNPSGYTAADNLTLDTGCSGTQGYVRGTNAFTTSATLTVLAAGTVTVIGSANVAPSSTGTVLFPEDTLVDIVFSLNADPTCAVTESDVVVNCCDDIDPVDFTISHTCTDSDAVDLTYTNGSGATMIFKLIDSTSALISTRTVAAGSTVITSVTVDPDKTYYVYVMSATSTDCPQTLLYTFDAGDCCDDVLDAVVISRECRAGIGAGSIGTLVVTNGTVGPKTIQVYLIVGSSSTLLYSGNDAVFEYTPSTPPSTTSVRIVVEDCEKTESFSFNCEP